MRYLLDCNVISEFRKVSIGKAAKAVSAWAASIDPDSLYLSPVTIMELEVGVLQKERRDAGQGTILLAWLQDSVLSAFAKRILVVDTVVALQTSGLHVPNPRPFRDAFIAATALVHGMTVVTRNVADFEPMGVAVLNPWLATMPTKQPL